MDGQKLLQRPLLAFAGASLAAVALGALVCALSGVPASLWIRNLAAWGIGGVAAAALARSAGRPALVAVLALAPVGLALTATDEGLEGVRRWLVVGPVRLNAAMLLLPSAAVAMAVVAERARWWWIPALLALAVLAAQPDASQATAWALAIAVVAAGLRERGWPTRAVVAAAAVAIAALAWTRPDPLAPVPEVEEVIQLAAAQTPLLAVLGVVLLMAAAAAPALTSWTAERREVRRAGVALTALLGGWIAAPALGAFPVPFVGIGLSPILGAWLGVGLLAASRQGPPA